MPRKSPSDNCRICKVYFFGAGKQTCEHTIFNPLTPRSDQHEISLYNVNTLASRQVMRIRKLSGLLRVTALV